MKICKSCTTEKALDEFYKNHLGYYQSSCKPCSKKQADEYRKANPEKRRQYTAKWREKHRNTAMIKAQTILDGMVRRSKAKGFARPEFTKAEVAEIISGKCAKTGIQFEFDQSKYSKSPWTPVPDRIDSSKGYTKENVQWVCHMYNSMKQDFSEEDVDTFIAALLASKQ